VSSATFNNQSPAISDAILKEHTSRIEKGHQPFSNDIDNIGTNLLPSNATAIVVPHRAHALWLYIAFDTMRARSLTEVRLHNIIDIGINSRHD
jgi:hypothetical protein